MTEVIPVPIHLSGNQTDRISNLCDHYHRGRARLSIWAPDLPPTTGGLQTQSLRNHPWAWRPTRSPECSDE